MAHAERCDRDSASGRRQIGMIGVAAVLACCTPSDAGDRSIPDVAPPVHTAPIVLFVSPDSIELEALRARFGEDFEVVGDDAMWYRALARELIDSLQIAHASTHSDSAHFLIDGRAQVVSWSERPPGWFVVVYDGVNRPVVVADIEIRSVLPTR